MERFIVVDLETTSREADKAHVVEWAAIVDTLVFFSDTERFGTYRGMVKPPIPIPPETSAVHHIVDADVQREPTWDVESRRMSALFDEPGAIAVAHNAAYERTVLAPLNLPCKWLCTYKAALRVWPDAPGHSNETLRYFLGLGGGRSSIQEPHSAMHDARVTHKILEELIALNTSVDDMVKWTDEPALLPRCPLGDWRGKPWSEVDAGFLLWILRKITDRDDVRFCARTELDRRERESREQQSAAAADDAPF